MHSVRNAKPHCEGVYSGMVSPGRPVELSTRGRGQQQVGKQEGPVIILASLQAEDEDQGAEPRLPDPLPRHMELDSEIRYGRGEWRCQPALIDGECQLNTIRQSVVKELGAVPKRGNISRAIAFNETKMVLVMTPYNSRPPSIAKGSPALRLRSRTGPTVGPERVNRSGSALQRRPVT